MFKNGDEKLTGTDVYPLWKYQINILFKSSGLTEIFNGSSKYDSCETIDEKSKWTKQDGKAQKYIMTTVETSLLTHILQADTSHKMMIILKSIFENESDNTKCELLQK